MSRSHTYSVGSPGRTRGVRDEAQRSAGARTINDRPTNPQHFEWNFGFNLMSLGVSRQVNMSVLYERLASSVLSRRYLRGDSLVYGLGVPFMAYQDRIQCYSRDGWCVLDVHVHARSMYKPLIMLVFVHIRYVLDGLGYVPPAEMEVAGVTLKVRGHSHMHRWTCPCP